MSIKLGQTVSGLLNASFGNAVEIIVGIAALLQGSSDRRVGTLPELLNPSHRPNTHSSNFSECYRPNT